MVLSMVSMAGVQAVGRCVQAGSGKKGKEELGGEVTWDFWPQNGELQNPVSGLQVREISTKKLPKPEQSRLWVLDSCEDEGAE